MHIAKLLLIRLAILEGDRALVVLILVASMGRSVGCMKPEASTTLPSTQMFTYRSVYIHTCIHKSYMHIQTYMYVYVEIHYIYVYAYIYTSDDC